MTRVTMMIGLLALATACGNATAGSKGGGGGDGLVDLSKFVRESIA